MANTHKQQNEVDCNSLFNFHRLRFNVFLLDEFTNLAQNHSIFIMRKLIIATIILFTGFTAFTQPSISKKENAEIEKLLQKQIEAWNEGNLEKFMETYWKSETLTFVGSRGPTYGWQATLDNYQKGYPDKKTMGYLNFKILDISKIDKNSIFVIGRFELTREVGDVAGHFTLVIQKKKGEWRIISDHSSAIAN